MLVLGRAVCPRSLHLQVLYSSQPVAFLARFPTYIVPLCFCPPAEEELSVSVDDVVGRCRVVPQGYPTSE